jgi:signal peptidase I
VVLVALALALFCRVFIISVYKIPTESMAPTFLPGDFILGSQVAYGLRFPWSRSTWFKSTPKKGDLIVCFFQSKPGVPYIKRITGIEGDEIETAHGKLKIGANQFYVLSDNPSVREDSRDLGLVTLDHIESQAKLIWFSFSPENQVRWRRVLTHLE